MKKELSIINPLNWSQIRHNTIKNYLFGKFKSMKRVRYGTDFLRIRLNME